MEGSQYNPRSEVRFAVVMYGGVSLAIYINGVAQELFRLVRATAPNEAKTDLAVSDDKLSPIELIYREIGRMRASALVDDWDTETGDAFAGTRFVVDILTGTSAGGINGILLAKALANGHKDIDDLKALWIKEGQIDDLLNEPRAYDGVRDIKYTSPPTSLLAGDRLRIKAEDAIVGMGGRADDAPQYADEIDLVVTMTDLQGLWRPLVLEDGDVLEPQHRAALRFVYARKDASGEGRNDFKGELDRLLAFAARATSSFPFAFAPVTLRDIASEFKDVELGLFADWREADADFPGFAFADGGYLQNKPITNATQALKRRRADQPVERKLLYVEPDPEPVPPVEKRNAARARPDALANTGAALIGLPSMQPIRDDIEALRERNDAVERVESLTRDVVEDVIRGDESPVDLEGGLAAYLGLKRRETVQDAADLVARIAAPEPDGEWHAAVYAAIWAHSRNDPRSDDPVGYGRNLDLRFRLRRLVYVQERIDDLLRAGDVATALLEAVLGNKEAWSEIDEGRAELRSEQGREALREAKATVNVAFADLRQVGRDLRARGVDGGGGPIEGQAMALAAAAFKWKEAAGQATDPRAFARAIERDPAIVEAADEFVRAVARSMKDAFDRDALVIERLEATDLPPHIAAVVTRTFRRAAAIDTAVFPASWSAVGEARRVAIHRVSPRDAASLVSMPSLDDKGKPIGRRRLAGVSLGHFGGFLDRKWRRNDMLWGRLDAAERLTSILVPGNTSETYRERAQAAILREEYRDAEAQEDLLDVIEPKMRIEFVAAISRDDGDQELVELFKASYRGPSDLESAKAISLAGRSAQVTGGVLTSVKRGHRLLQKPAFWVSRIGRFVWGFAELVAPPEGATLFGHSRRLAPQIAFLVALLLIALGTFAGFDGAQAAGWALLGGTAALGVIWWLFQGRPLFVPVCVFLGLALLTLATLEVLHHFEEDIRDGWEFLAAGAALIALTVFLVLRVRRSSRSSREPPPPEESTPST